MCAHMICKGRMQRILVIGNGGAGKSTLAKELGKMFDLPVVHLDRLWWLSGWVNRTADEFDLLLAKELEKPAWVLDGNYHRTFSWRLRRADFCAVLDVDTDVCLRNAKERAEKYAGRSRLDMPDGCIERLDEDFAKWIEGYREAVLPQMLDSLEESGVPYRIFSSADRAKEWFAGACKKV